MERILGGHTGTLEHRSNGLTHLPRRNVFDFPSALSGQNLGQLNGAYTFTHSVGGCRCRIVKLVKVDSCNHYLSKYCSRGPLRAHIFTQIALLKVPKGSQFLKSGIFVCVHVCLITCVCLTLVSQSSKLQQNHSNFQPDYFSLTEKPPEEFCLSPDASTSSSSCSSSQSHISVDLTQKRGEGLCGHLRNSQ